MGTIKEEVAKNLLFYRKKAGLTQKELAAMLGVKNTCISNWEAARSSMDIEELVVISRILNVTLKEMYGAAAVGFPEASYTQHELEVISAYRQKPEMHAAVDTLLGVQPEPVADPVDLAAELAQNLPKKVPHGK